MGVLGVLAVVDKVLSNRRVQGALTGKPQPMPATCGQDQRLDVLIEEVKAMNARLDDLIKLQAEALRLAAQQSRPAATMELLPEPPQIAQQAAEAAGIDMEEHGAFERRVEDDIAQGGALRLRKRKG